MKVRKLILAGFAVVTLAAVVTVLLTYLQQPGDGNAADGMASGSRDPSVNAALAVDVNPARTVGHESTSADALQIGLTDEKAEPPVPAPASAGADPEPAGPFSISGLVIDEAGRGIEGIQVAAFPKTVFAAGDGTDVERTRSERSAVSGIDGFYEVEGVADGEYRVWTEPDEQYEAAEAVVRAGLDTADLVLRQRRPDVAVAGTVLGDGEPLDGVQVAAVGQPSGAVYTEMDGTYSLRLQLAAGKQSYTLQFVREGYREKRSVVVAEDLPESGRVRVDADMEPAEAMVEVTGSVLDKKGSPVPGETVQLYSEAARQRYTAVSDRNGELWFPEVETSDDYLLSVRPTDSYRDFVQRNVQVSAAGADLYVVLEPLALGSLTGQMVDVDGQPVPDFSLWLRNTQAVNQPARLVTGDHQGFFEVDEITAGSLVFESRGSPLVSVSGIQLEAGQKKDVRLVLDWGAHRVAGLVMDDMGQPVSASELFVTSVRHDGGVRIQAVRRAVTDETGYFLVSQVGPGYHTIRVDVPGFRTAVFDHDVGSDSPEVIVRLERAYSNGM